METEKNHTGTIVVQIVQPAFARCNRSTGQIFLRTFPYLTHSFPIVDLRNRKMYLVDTRTPVKVTV